MNTEKNNPFRIGDLVKCVKKAEGYPLIINVCYVVTGLKWSSGIDVTVPPCNRISNIPIECFELVMRPVYDAHTYLYV